MSIDVNTTLHDLFEIAKFNMKDLKSGEIFIVKELFKGYEWNRISKRNRTKLGSMIYEHVNSKACSDISPLGKTPQNQQKYEKL